MAEETRPWFDGTGKCAASVIDLGNHWDDCVIKVWSPKTAKPGRACGLGCPISSGHSGFGHAGGAHHTGFVFCRTRKGDPAWLLSSGRKSGFGGCARRV
jgi:hypothetical protein